MKVIRWGQLLCIAVLASVATLAVSDFPKAETASPSAPSRDYRLGPSDKVRIVTFGEESLSGEFDIGGSGKVSFPLIGEVQAAGLSVSELQKELEDALSAGYLKHPQINVEVLTYRPFYILGEVRKPGEYPFRNGLTVMDAVATANGFTEFASKGRVYIKRVDEAKEHKYPLTSATPVNPGDTVRIPERSF